MPYTVALPDGRVVEFPDNVPKERAAEILRQQFPAPTAPTSMGDILASFGRGAAGSTKALTDVFGAENVASQALEDVSKGLEARMSPARRAELQRQAERSKRAAESGSMWEEIKAAAINIGEAPLQAAAEGVGSFVPYLPAMLLNPVAASIGLGSRALTAVNTVAKYAPRVIGTAQGAGSVKGSIYDAVYEAERKDGANEAEAKTKARKAQEYLGGNLDQILFGAGLGYVAGSSGVERLLTKEGAQKAAPGVVRRVGTALAEEVPTEALQGGQEALAANLALQRTGRDVPTFQGVAGQAAQEGLMAGLSAAPVAALRSPRSYIEAQEREKQLQARAEAERRAAEAAAEQEAFRKTPEYLDDLERRYAELRKTEEQLQAAAKVKIDRTDPLEVEEKRRAQEALDEFKDSQEYIALKDEYVQAYDALRPRQQERRRQARVEAAPEGTQLGLMGEPAGVPDQSLPGQIKALEQYIGSYDNQIKEAQKTGDAQQVALLQQKQNQARDQIAALLPDAASLTEAKQLAQRQLESFQTQINDLAQQEKLEPAQYAQLQELNNRAAQVRQAIPEIEAAEKAAEKYRPTEVLKPIDKEKTLATLDAKLKQQAELGEDVSKTLAKIQEVQATQEQPALFGEEDLREIKTRDLGDIIADERERVKALREKLDAERAALQRMATTPLQSSELQRRKQELVEQARKTAEEIRRQNALLVDLERYQGLLNQIGKQITALQAQGRPVPEVLTNRMRVLRRDIDAMKTQLAAERPEPQGQKELLPAEEGEFAPRVTDEELMAQRDRDIAALLDQFLAPALGVTEAKETLEIPTPEGGTQRIDLVTTGRDSYAAIKDQIEDVRSQRDLAVEKLFESGGATADLLRSEISALTVMETELRRELAKLSPLSKEYRHDLHQLVFQAFERPSFVGQKPNLAEQRYLAAVEDLREVENNTLDAIYEMRKLDYKIRTEGLPDVIRRSWSALTGEGPEVSRSPSIAEVIQEHPIMRAGMAAQKRLSAAQRQVDALAKAMPMQPDITAKSLDEKLDALVDEFAEGTPEQLAKKVTARRVAMGQRPAALSGADIGERIAANEAQIKQIRQDLKYAGRPTDPEKVAARDKLVAELQPLLQENKDLRAQYNKLQAGQAAPAAPEETGEVAEMRQELAGIERALASGQFDANPRIKQQMQAARDELQGRIEAAVGPQRPEAKQEAPLLPGMKQRFAQFEYRPVAPEALNKARADYVKATQKIEDIRKALGRLDEMGPQYFQEVATTYKQNIEREAAERTRLEGAIKRLEKEIKQQIALSDALPEDRRKDNAYLDRAAEMRVGLENFLKRAAQSERRSEELKQADAEVTKFLNLAKLAGVGKGRNLREQLEQARDKALEDKDKKEAAVKDLEARQRMYEQQEAAKRGVELGDIEAERITSGEAAGFVSGRGKALAEKPKSKRSWVISTDSKAAVPKPNEAGKMEAATQNAFNLLAQAKKETAAATEALKGAPTPESLAPIKAALERVQSEINRHYTPAQATEITKEIALLQERLSDFPVALPVADVATKYTKATTAKRGLPAAERVAQMMFESGTAERKAAEGLKVAEQGVAAAQQKYDAALKSVRQAEGKLKRIKDPAKIRGLNLYINNVYGSAQNLRDGISDAEQTQKRAEQQYMVARLERLLLVQQMGEHAKTEAANLTARLTQATDTVTALTKERDAALEREAKIRGKLTAAEAAAEKAQEAAETERSAAAGRERQAEEKAKQEAIAAAAAARLQADAIRSGLRLPGVRVERDTAGKLMTAVQADIKKQLATAETNLTKAIRGGDTAAIREATAEVQRRTTELDQVYAKAPVTVTEVGPAAEQRREEIEDAFAPAPVEGMRLAPRREGPSVRYARGGNKAIMQAGIIKLRAAGLSQKAANAISAYVKKNQIKGSKTAEIKARREAEFAALTDGMTEDQVKAMLAEGQRLMGLGPTPELIAKRTAYQDALAAVDKAKADVQNAKTSVIKELAQDELDLAEQRSDAAERAYNQARDMYEMSSVKAGKKAERAAVDQLLEEAEAEFETLPASRASAAIEDFKDNYANVFAAGEVNLASEETVDALQDGRLADALRDIAANGASDLLRRNAKAALDFVYKTKVVFVPDLHLDGKSVPAYYSSAANTIYFNADVTPSQEDVVHEATHGASLYALTLPDERLNPAQRRARRELQAMYATLKKDKALADQYGMFDVAEFASEMQANAAFRRAIGDRKWYGGSFIRRFFNLLLELLGIRRPELLTDKAEEYIKTLYMQSRRFGVERVGAAPRGSVLVADDPSKIKQLEDNLFGLGARVQYVDRLGAADEALVKAQKDGKLSSLEAENAQYFMRLSDQVSQAAGQFITSGPVKFVKDKLGDKFEERYEASTGVNLVNMANDIESAAKAGLGTAQQVETMLTVLVAGDRANATPNGWQRLAGDKAAAAKAEYETYKQLVAANPTAKKYVDNAISEYKAYNDGLITFVEQSGYLSKREADGLRSKPYVPFYRVVKDEIRLYVDNANWIRIGDLKNNPDLKQFLGSSEQIMPILTSAVQNTYMLTRAAMHNKGTHETASALFKAGFASRFGEGRGPDSPNTVRFKVHGKDYFALIDSDAFGIPADLIVKGMEGLKVATPELVKALGIPANWVRKFVTRGPAYIFRQLVREPIQAAIVQGVDGVPVLNALRQMAKMKAGRSDTENELMRGLVVSSNIFTGDEQDMQMFLRDISTGKGKWDKLMGKLDALAMQTDAATRASLYEDSIKKGLTKRQAQFRAFESQNFSRRGLSPSMQMMRTLVPFFNAQIQGLDVLYRAMRGRLPFEEKLKLREKMLKRGLLLTVTALAYAMAMRNDEEYQELSPEIRYGNFLFKIPGVDDYLKVPIPYEVGILFKALPEAIVDAAFGDTKSSEAIKAIGKLFWQSAPGVTPVAVKPWVEAALNQTLYGPIEDRRMEGLPAEQRYREETPEVLKALGSLTGTVGVSPRMLEHFANAYGSSLLLSILHIPDIALADTTEGEKPSTPASKQAFIGGIFQSKEGRFIIDRAYANMEEINRAVNGYEDLLKRGKRAEAEAFAQRYATQLEMGSIAGTFRKRMGDMFAAEREIRINPELTAAQKDEMIKELKAAQRMEAREFYRATERTTPQ